MGFIEYFLLGQLVPNFGKCCLFGAIGGVIGSCSGYDWKNGKETKKQTREIYIGLILGVLLGLLI